MTDTLHERLVRLLREHVQHYERHDTGWIWWCDCDPAKRILFVSWEDCSEHTREHLATLAVEQAVEVATQQRGYWDRNITPKDMRESVHSALSLLIVALGEVKRGTRRPDISRGLFAA